MSCGNSTEVFYKDVESFDFQGRNKLECYGGNLTQNGNIVSCVYEDDNTGLNIGGIPFMRHNFLI